MTTTGEQMKENEKSGAVAWTGEKRTNLMHIFFVTVFKYSCLKT
jgi:hypothetical protein